MMWGSKPDEQLEQEAMEQAKGMDATDVFNVLKRFNRFANILIDEFTYGNLRIDAIIIDTSSKWIKGFEIKTSRPDFLRDQKWQNYSTFCSSLSIVCPWGLISKEEIDKPYGLLWVSKNDMYKWQKRPKNFQKRDALAWKLLYYHVVETEFRRIWWDHRKDTQ